MKSAEEQTIFDRQRQLDPQGVIDSLVAQTTRQGAEIHRRGLEIDRLTKENAALRVELQELKSGEQAPF